MDIQSGSLSKSADIRYTNRNPDHNFKYLLEMLPVAVYTCDKKGFISFYNKHAALLWGREPEIGKDLWCGSWKIYNSEGRYLPLDECPMAIVLKTGQIVNDYEIIIERPDGSKLYVMPHPQPLFDENGELEGALNMLVDVTHRKSEEEKAARLTAVVQSSVAAIISKTLDGIITSWNPSAERMFGYKSEEMVGKSITKLIPHDRLSEESDILERLGRGERIEHYETKRLTKYGKLIDISLAISPIRDEKGRIIGASKIARDITKAKEVARLMKESEERFRMAVEATKLGTWEYNPVSNELSWSGECRKIYGYPENGQVNYGLFVKHIHPDDAHFVQEAVEKAMSPEGNGQYDIQFRIKRYSDGQVRWIRSQGKVYFDNIYNPARFIGTVLDITEDKTAKEKLEHLVSERTHDLENINKQLQRSNSDLEQFASVASHDLQEPLRKVQMYSDRILQECEHEGTFEKYFPKIISATERMSKLIKDILHYAQIGNDDVQFRKVDLNETVENVCGDFEVLMKEKKAVVNANLLPSIYGSPVQLHQLFANLISNSIKFSKDDPVISITSRRLKRSPEFDKYENLREAEAYIELTLQDNGIGFDQKYASQIFEIFQRLEYRQQYSGTGIGLAVCKKIVENHRGAISVTSRPGEGTKFCVLLPE